MADDIDLYNGAVVGENPEEGFLMENGRLHAVERSVAALKRDKSSPELIIPALTEALKALVNYSRGKVPPHFLHIDWSRIEDSPHQQRELVYAIEQIFAHLPHHERNHLSSMVHHAK